MSFKLFSDVELKLVGKSLKHLGKGKFFYSARTNGGRGNFSLSYSNGVAVGEIKHKGKIYEIGTWKKDIFYVTEFEEQTPDSECGTHSNEENFKERSSRHVNSGQVRKRNNRGRKKTLKQNTKKLRRKQALVQNGKSASLRKKDKSIKSLRDFGAE